MSIRHIAKKTGFSVATVSRVLNNSGLVNSETRQKVLEQMELVNFKTKRARRKITTIGVAVPDFKPGRLNYMFTREFLAGVLETASQFDTSVKILDLNDIVHVTDKPGSYNDFCREKGVNALIHVQLPIQFHDYVEKLADDGIPQVVMEHKFDRADIGWIAIDNYGSSFHMAEYLVKLKNSSFAIITASRQFSGHVERHRGFVEGLQKHQIQIPKEWDIERQTASVQAGSSAILNLLTASPQIPKVIYITNVELALGGIQALTAHGVRLPEDTIVCLFDDSQYSQWVSNPVLYLSQPAFDMGSKSAAFLLTRKADEELKHVIVPELFISPKITEISRNLN
jgi:DNA-binding LacI/PurR family transcriptional regulator